MTLSNKKIDGLLIFFLLVTMTSVNGKENKIYHKGWIDFNKNGVKDIFEDPTQPIEKRVITC